jgi:hypothetical protein
MLTAAVSEAIERGETKGPTKERTIAEAANWFIAAMREK